MLDELVAQAKLAINEAKALETLENLRVDYLGKNGKITAAMKVLATMEPEERKNFGQTLNIAKEEITELLATKKQKLGSIALEVQLASEQLDVTLPARQSRIGSIHPLSKAMLELMEIFATLGFGVETGPSIEDDWHNFTSLNIPENHPARQMHDSFYLTNGKVLRTHTSPIQIRTMSLSAPPFRFIAPGRTYRCDSDMTHTPMFHQIEGVMIDTGTHLGHMKYLITSFIREFFEDPTIEFRFRSSFFPFTEPSFEVDIRRTGTNRWLEVLGCGMVHPNVLQNVKLDSSKYQGFAFGLGIERFAMLKYGINDLRQFYESDQKWLEHYSFSAFDIPNILGGLTR